MNFSYYSEEKIRDMQPLIILGMHRSGTSLTVRLLKDIGIYLGGYLSRDAEAVYFQKMNRRIYAAARSSWGDIDSLLHKMKSDVFIQSQTKKALKKLFPGKSLGYFNHGISSFFGIEIWDALSRGEKVEWGWKDPRSTITFPIWLNIFPKAKILYVLRNGIDVAISIHRRSLKQSRKIWKRMFPIDYCPNTLDFGYCFELWEKHVAYFDENKQIIPSNQYMEIRYEDLLSAPKSTLLKISEFTDFPLRVETLDKACNQIDHGRLINTSFARPYRTEIHPLINSQWMQKFNYTYQVDLSS